MSKEPEAEPEERGFAQKLEDRSLIARRDAAEIEAERLERKAREQEERLSRLSTGKRKLALRICDDTGGDLPEGCGEILSQEIRLSFDWKDRLRIFFGAGVIIESAMLLRDKIEGPVETVSDVSVTFPRKPRGGESIAYAAEPDTEDVLGNLP